MSDAHLIGHGRRTPIIGIVSPTTERPPGSATTSG
jgi:hypothetical protein